MKTQRKLILLLLLIVFNTSFSQQESKRKEDSKVTRKIDNTGDEVKKTGKTLNSATDSITSTIKDAKKSAKELKIAIFGERKNKKNRKKIKKKGESITIQINSIAYSNSDLTSLQNYLTKINGVKKVSKSYTNGNASILVITKENADAVWQQIPLELNKVFIVKDMNQKHILLHFEKQDLNKE